MFPYVSLFLYIDEDGGRRRDGSRDDGSVLFAVPSSWSDFTQTLLNALRSDTTMYYELFAPRSSEIRVEEVEEDEKIGITGRIGEELVRGELLEEVIRENRVKVEIPHEEGLVKEFLKAFGEGKVKLFEEGLGGTYLVKGAKDENLAVFKPSDEEPGSTSNPKGNFSTLKNGVKPGEGYLREVAAYMMDHGNLAGVPFTQIVEVDINGKKKVGSLQKFVSNIGNMTDLSPSLISISDVQKIAQLDIRMYNLDRNDENMLVTKENGVHRLVPIDHAYSLPSNIEDGAWFDWMNWKQAKQPISQEILEYIENISIEKDEEILKSLNFSEDSINVMKMSTLALKTLAKKGYNMHEIATFITRPTRKEISPLEEVVRDSKTASGSTALTSSFWDHFIKILNERMLPK